MAKAGLATLLSLSLILGEHGIVYKGVIKSIYAGVPRETVAIKTLKGISEALKLATQVYATSCIGFVQKELVTDLLKECVKMHKLRHPNVLKLTGVCLDGGPAPYIIMPYMANGSLLSYLKENRDALTVDSNVEEVKMV